MRHVKELTSYKIHCSRLCEQTYEKKLKQQETIVDEVMESEIKYLEDFNQHKNIIKKLHDEIKSLNDNNNELKKQIDDHNAELVKGKRELEEMIEINRNMISTIRLLEEESQRNNQRDIQQDRSTQKVLNGKEVREPVNTSQEIINKSSRAPRGKDSVESKKILIIGDETARGCASKLKTYVTQPNVIIEGVVKPGIELSYLAESLFENSINFGRNDFIIVAFSTNNVSNSRSLAKALRYILPLGKLTNLVIYFKLNDPKDINIENYVRKSVRDFIEKNINVSISIRFNVNSINSVLRTFSYKYLENKRIVGNIALNVINPIESSNFFSSPISVAPA
nr:unnamed protein product [Callosobruchus analis]